MLLIQLFYEILAKLSFKALKSNKLLSFRPSIITKANVYCFCVCSILLYSSETWTLSSVQKKKIKTFLLRCHGRILRIAWQQKISNEKLLKRTDLTTVQFTLSQRRLDHVLRMGAERIRKSLSRTQSYMAIWSLVNKTEVIHNYVLRTYASAIKKA